MATSVFASRYEHKAARQQRRGVQRSVDIQRTSVGAPLSCGRVIQLRASRITGGAVTADGYHRAGGKKRRGVVEGAEESHLNI